ncbi:uncharacterized protein LOC123530812 [Mercenaria mercenaria]|uniref:uncharacterized protein LOC123530812 n=1 Tax=Mercenaria mercenaria TaxID=6596 RepID=UPI00234EEA7E|nr:uncharacterized protein LOC123530812 [Mercenaria mercenaria]
MGNDCTGSKPSRESQSGGPQKGGQSVPTKESGHHGFAIKGGHHGQPNEGMPGETRHQKNSQYGLLEGGQQRGQYSHTGGSKTGHFKGRQYQQMQECQVGYSKEIEKKKDLNQASTCDIHAYFQENSSEERNELKTLRQENMKLTDAKKGLEKSNLELAKDRDRYKEAMVRKENELKLLQDKTVRYREKLEKKKGQIASFQQDLKKIQKERDNLLTRYSALAGSKLTDGNANIADLSDENRPTKLAEQYAELYDNEWTDAFTVLSADGTRSSDDVCHVLAKAFCIIYSTTRKEADRDLETLTNAIKLFLKADKLPTEVLKAAKDRRKKEPGRYLDRIRKLYSDDIGKVLSSEEQKHVSQFLQKSIDLCWLMAIQDPPLYVDTNLSRMDEKFDTNHFKPYMATGKFIDFVVWPALYLFEDGNMLSKGVAQGKKVRRKSQPYNNVEIVTQQIKVLKDPHHPYSTNPVSFMQKNKENITILSVGKPDKSGNDYAVVPQSQKKLGSSARHQSQDLNCSQNAGENISPRDEGIKDTTSVSREHESASTPGPATTYEANSRPKSYASVSLSATTKPTTTTLKEWTYINRNQTMTLKYQNS